MRSRLEQKLIDKSYALIDLPQSSFKHFSFLVRRNKIVCVGWNWKKTHTISKEYRFQKLHSEGHCILSFPHDLALLHHYRMYNVRINNLGRVSMSAPCDHCRVLLMSHGIRDVFFTNERGQFEPYFQ